MNPCFDTGTGELLLEQTSFDLLIDWAAGRSLTDPALDDLRQAGVITPDGLHAAIGRAVEAVVKPLCQLRIDVFDHDGQELCAEGWVDAETSAFLADRADGSRQFFETDPTLIPAVVARIIGLAPRPFHPDHDQPILMPRSVFEGLLAGTVPERTLAAQRFASTEPNGTVDLLVAGPWRRWTITVLWNTPYGEPGSHVIQAIDTRDGLWRCEVSGADASLWPTRSTAIWLSLTRLLPEEVDQ